VRFYPLAAGRWSRYGHVIAFCCRTVAGPEMSIYQLYTLFLSFLDVVFFGVDT
jgi:hypothetical protein